MSSTSADDVAHYAAATAAADNADDDDDVDYKQLIVAWQLDKTKKGSWTEENFIPNK